MSPVASSDTNKLLVTGSSVNAGVRSLTVALLLLLLEPPTVTGEMVVVPLFLKLSLYILVSVPLMDQ